jgi:hypothetical protein
MDVLVSVEENPRVSTRDIASNMSISNQTVQAMLRKHKFKSYIPQKVQVLEENDRSRREQFCNVYLNMLQLVSDRNHVFSQNRNRISFSVTVSAETETFEFSYFLDTDLCTVARKKCWSSMSFQNLVRLSQMLGLVFN